MTEELSSRKWYAYLEGAWVDLTGDVLQKYDVIAKWGMRGNAPFDIVADVGSMKFTLNNSSGKYSPHGTSALSGWKKGVPVKMVLSYDGDDYIRFRGRLESIDLSIGLVEEMDTATCTVLDWLEYASNYPLESPGYKTDIRANDALDVILPDIPIQPQEHDFETGDNIFPTAFDAVSTTTSAYTEFSKLTKSEFGRIYLRKSKLTGERLIFEGASHRTGLNGLTEVPVTTGNSDFLLLETSDKILQETGDGILLDQTQSVTMDNSMMSLDISYGDNLINRVTVTAYPRRVDTSPQTLFSLDTPLLVGSGQTVEFRGSYADPTGGTTVNAISDTMIDPVVTTDYTFNTSEDGTGTDITANLTVTATYGTEGVTYSLVNTSTSSGYVTKLQARGYGVYTYNPVETIRKNSASYNEYGYKSETLEQMYQQSVVAGKVEADKVLNMERQPRTKLNSVEFCANRSTTLMMMALALDVGDLVHIKEDRTGTDGYFYIQGVEMRIKRGGILVATWIVTQAFSLQNGLSLIDIEFDAPVRTNYIDFGYVPKVSNLDTKTISAWVYPHGTVGAIATMYAYGSYKSIFYLYPTRALRYRQYFEGGSYGEWRTGNNVFTYDAWHHVVLTRDTSSSYATEPKIYVDGVSLVIVTESGQTDVSVDETGIPLLIGYGGGNTLLGLLRDVRIYNRVLSDAEVSAIYAEGAGGTGVLDGLMFQTPTVFTNELSYFEDHTLLSTDRIIDNIHGIIGTPEGVPVTRLIP